MGRATLKRRAPRGQAVVELVLGCIVFVTVLLFAIHFAEVGFLSVKVTEAQHSALFDATGYKQHVWPDKDTSPADKAASKAGKDGQSRYQDFDSRTTASGKSLSQVFTVAKNMKVQCQMATDDGPKYKQAGVTKNAYADNGHIGCTASAQLSSTGIPQHFLDQGGNAFFQNQQAVPTTFNVCGLGRGTCSRQLTMLVDDWGLMGPDESKNCKMTMDSPGCDNKAFWSMAESVFKKNGSAAGAMGSAMAFGLVHISPINENQFWMSAPGEESGFTQSVSPSEGLTSFGTTPGASLQYKTSYQKDRSTCWLGFKCP